MSEATKNNLHERNRHRAPYDFKYLVTVESALLPFVKVNEFDATKGETIDFANPQAVKALNRALLKAYYGIGYWDFPPGYLCPPIPGRADYIHYLADLLGRTKKDVGVKVLDIGTGANCIYPLIGNFEYGWSFVATEVDPISLSSAEKIIKSNNDLEKSIELRRQPHKKNIFKGIIHPDDNFTLTMCNPPFHSSAAEAQQVSTRKWNNLGRMANLSKPALNFGGKNNELWCEGGEKVFIRTMIEESFTYKNQVRWFTTLVSRRETLLAVSGTLKKVNISESRIVEMSQGQKVSRFLAWTYQ